MIVLIADDHGLYRAGLRGLLVSLDDAVVLREASSMEEALQIIDDGVDLALFDLNMPGRRTLDHVRTIRLAYPSMKIVIVSGSDARDDVMEALAAGVHGFIRKSQRDQDVATALRDILGGRIYVPPSLSDFLVPAGEGPGRANDHKVADLSSLTERQTMVLRQLARGLTNKEIARVLSIAEPTVKIHVSSLMRALGVRNRTEAAVAARDLIE